MKKKFLSLLLALAMCLSLCVPGFATNVGTNFSELNYVNVQVEGEKLCEK